MESLFEERVVQKFQSSSGRIVICNYLVNSSDCHEYLHIQYIKCGKLLHLDYEFMNEFNGHLAGHHYFVLELKSSMLYGICDSCKAKE